MANHGSLKVCWAGRLVWAAISWPNPTHQYWGCLLKAIYLKQFETKTWTWIIQDNPLSLTTLGCIAATVSRAWFQYQTIITQSQRPQTWRRTKRPTLKSDGSIPSFFWRICGKKTWWIVKKYMVFHMFSSSFPLKPIPWSMDLPALTSARAERKADTVLRSTWFRWIPMDVTMISPNILWNSTWANDMKNCLVNSINQHIST